MNTAHTLIEHQFERISYATKRIPRNPTVLCETVEIEISEKRVIEILTYYLAETPKKSNPPSH